MKSVWLLFVGVLLLVSSTYILAQSDRRANPGAFNGLDMNLGNLSRLSNAQTRSISPENFTGQKGKGGMDDLTDTRPNHANAKDAARELGRGWKVNPFVRIKSGETFTLADIQGPGAVQHIWMTPTGNWRYSILRFYWDDEKSHRSKYPSAIFSVWAGVNTPP